MRVLIIPSERYLSLEEPLAGIFQRQQAHALRRAGLKVGVIAPMPRSLRLMRLRLKGWPKGIEWVDDEGIPTCIYQGWGWVPGRVPYLSIHFYVSLGTRLFKEYVLRYGLPDIIHAHNVLYSGVITSAIKMFYGIPFVLTEHSSAYLTNQIRKWQIHMIRNVLINADARIVVSPFLGDVLEKRYGSIIQPYHWIPNILDKAFEEQDLAKPSRRTKGDLFVILTIGNLVAIKNHAVLLRAFAKAFKGNNSVQLKIGGDGPLFGKLKDLARRLGIANQVEFLGALNREQVLYEMSKTDIFVLSSNYETFGVVLIEALACGKPVIATDSGGPRYIVNNENGILVPPGDETALAHAMERMINNITNYNPKIIRKGCLERYGESTIVDRIIGIYDHILKERCDNES